MIETILWTVYLIGWFLFPRYAIRVVYTDFGKVDGFDCAMAIAGGWFFGWLWPLVAVGRLGYIGWVRYVPPFEFPSFLKIKSIEKPTTYRQRQAAKLDKREVELAQREAWVRERELR